MIAAIFLLLQGIAALSVKSYSKLSDLEEITSVNAQKKSENIPKPLDNTTEKLPPPAPKFELDTGLIVMISVTGVIIIAGITVAVLLSQGCFKCGKFKEEDQ